MSHSSPLAQPGSWNLVAEGYVVETAPLLSHYARDAIGLARLAPGDRVLDVAAGPGTLSLLAAGQAGRVVAVDFSADMLDVLRRRADEAGFDHVEARIADGQALPFADDSFDAAFSMFGLMFFPDREAGFRELRRVLAPGGRAVVSSWTPLEQIPLVATLFEILGSLLPDLPFGDGKQPLADADGFREEMTAGGFAAVEIHTFAHRLERESVRAFWQSQARGSAPIVLLREQLSAQDWTELSRRVVLRLEEEFGTGPVHMEWPAHLGMGTVPAGEQGGAGAGGDSPLSSGHHE